MDSPARPSQAKMVSSTGGTEGSSPASSPASAASLAAAMAAPKFGTLVPNRIFVGGISASTSEAELAQLFSHYGNVKATKIIADRGGVSKGYGFVTFETEEEAKRLQQESECIVLRERKLNIAPAIKKQPFNRSFDGGTGSPPTVPTSTYYYTNGMGIPYQNGMTFYNAGAPAPGAAIAPPADPTALYQAAGVFGPQATASHQTFAPMMYPMPAPSLYMPQQYQYSPMPYEPYFPGTSGAGAPQFLYATNGAQGTTSGGGNGSGNSGSGSAGGTGVGAASSSSATLGPSPPQFQTHFYGPATAASHHHPGALSGSPHGPPPPPHQVEHLYYSYPPPPHVAQPPPHHGGPPLALAADQQLLVYTEITGQPSAGDSQICQQEDARSSSSHSEQLQQGGASTSDSGGGGGGGGGGGQPPEPPGPSAHPLIPLKYPMSNRYASFHPVTIHSTKLPPQQQQTSSSTNAATGDSSNVSDDANLHYRTVSVYPTPLYIPHGASYHAASPSAGGSLLPTPPQQPYDMGKFRDHSKSPLFNGPYNKGASPHGASGLLPPPSAYVKAYNGPPLQSSPHAHQKYPRVTTPPARLSHHQQYGKRGLPSPTQQSPAPGYYFSQKPAQYGAAPPRQPPTGQPFVYGIQPAYGMSHPGAHKGYHAGSPDARHTSRRSAMVNSYRGSNLTMSANTSANTSASSISETPATGASKAPKTENVKVAEAGDEYSPGSATTATAIMTTTMTTTTTTTATSATSAMNTDTDTNTNTAAKASSSSPPSKSHSPTTRPLPNLSPSPNLNQVQFFGSSGAGGQRHNSSSTPGQQRGGGNRFSAASSMSNRGGGKASNVLRQTSGAGKYKMNGIVPPGGKLPVDDSGLGGGGDASTVGRLPITPPATPQQSASEQSQQQLNESCHQMQALTL